MEQPGTADEAVDESLRESFPASDATAVHPADDPPANAQAMRDAAARRYSIPLLADFEPKGAVAGSYGVYSQQTGTSERALFVIDANGIIRWSHVSPMGINPGADGILAALESLQAGTP